MGAVPSAISVSRIRAARTPEECVAAGGIVKTPPPWSKKTFVCALPPRWLREMRGQALVAGDVGYFATETTTPPRGYVLARSRHPFWKRGAFYHVVKPETARRRGWEIVRMGGCGPAVGQFALARYVDSALHVALGAAIPVGLRAIVMPWIVRRRPEYQPHATIAIGALSTLPYFVYRKTPLTTGMMASGISLLVTGILDLIFAKTMAPAAAAMMPAMAPATMGQLTEEDIKELEAVAKELSGVGQTTWFEEEEEAPPVIGQGIEEEEAEAPPVIEMEGAGLGASNKLAS